MKPAQPDKEMLIKATAQLMPRLNLHRSVSATGNPLAFTRNLRDRSSYCAAVSPLRPHLWPQSSAAVTFLQLEAHDEARFEVSPRCRVPKPMTGQFYVTVSIAVDRFAASIVTFQPRNDRRRATMAWKRQAASDRESSGGSANASCAHVISSVGTERSMVAPDRLAGTAPSDRSYREHAGP